MEDIDIIITTDYLYGMGSIYASLYENSNYDIEDNLPSSNHYDYSNAYDTTNSILKINIDKSHAKLNENSMLLIAVECKDKCFFELNVADMFKTDVKYLDVNRENIFYIYKSLAKTTLIYYNWSEKDLNLAAFTYKGKANIKVYMNNTYYNDQGSSKVETVELTKFSLDYSNNPTYHDTISNNASSLAYRNIFFEVEPLADVGFYIKLTHDKEWAKIKINKINTFSVDSDTKNFYGYFDVLGEFENTHFTVRSLKSGVTIRVAIKYILIDKSLEKLEENMKHSFDVPSGRADINGMTDGMLGSYSVKIPSLPKEKIGAKFSRILVQLQMLKFYSLDDENIKFDILVSTNVNGTTIVDAEQEQLIFSQINHQKEDELKIYKLKKKLPEDNLLVLEISTCVGSLEYKICDRMIFNKDESCSVTYQHENTDGRKLIIVNLLQNPGDNFYLVMWHKNQRAKDCRLDKDSQFICVDKSEGTIYYFTTTLIEYLISFSTNKGTIMYKNDGVDSIQLSWGPMLSSNDDQSVVVASANYEVYVSEETYDYEHMDSICYLSRINKMNGGVGITMNKDGTASITKLTPKKKYYVNVLAKNLKTSELIAYKPIEIDFQPQSIPLYLIILGTFVIIILAVLVYYYYKKFRLTKKILQYEVSDVRNMSTLPKTETELENVIRAKQEQKYANLTIDSSSV